MSNLSSFVKRIRDIMWNDAGVNGDAQRIEQMAWILFLKVYDAKETDWEFDDENYKSIIPDNCRWANWAVDDRSGNAIDDIQCKGQKIYKNTVFFKAMFLYFVKFIFFCNFLFIYTAVFVIMV